MSIFCDEKVWRFTTNFWTVVFLIFIVLDFCLCLVGSYFQSFRRLAFFEQRM
jgi:hypothetical protein